MSEFDDAFTQSYLRTMYPMPVEQGQPDDVGLMQTMATGAGMPASERGTEEQRSAARALRQADLGLKGRAVADTAAGLAKGAVQGAVGLPGDLVAIARGVYEMGIQGADIGMLDAFLIGLEKGTILPTSEDVGAFLAKNLGPIVPDDVSIDSVREYRQSRADAGETVGELLSPAGVLTGAVKNVKKVAGAVASGAKAGAK